jgi:hypothetical protein
MPTVRARIREGDTVRRHSNKYGPGITPRYLTSGEVGDIEFDTALFTEKQATEWLQSHDFMKYTLSAGEDEPENELHRRVLSVEITPSSEIQKIDGGLLVPGVRLLAPGTWTDGTQKTPCRYTQENLERFVSNWTDRSYWSRHERGVPRDITDRIANIQNIRYDAGVTADLFYHGATTKSKDAIAIVEAAQAGKVPWPYSSVEMRTRDKWLVAEKLFEAQEIVFDGAAMVNQGACRVCKIRNNEWAQTDAQEDLQKKEAETPAAEPEIQEDTMEQKDLDAAVAAAVAPLMKELEALKAAQKPPEAPKVEIPKELTESIADIGKRLEKLEKGPADPKTQGGLTKDLSEAPEYYVSVNRKSGTIGGGN